MTQYRMSLDVSLYKQNKKDPKYTLLTSLLHLVRHHLQQQKTILSLFLSIATTCLLSIIHDIIDHKSFY